MTLSPELFSITLTLFLSSTPFIYAIVSPTYPPGLNDGLTVFTDKPLCNSTDTSVPPKVTSAILFPTFVLVTIFTSFAGSPLYIVYTSVFPSICASGTPTAPTKELMTMPLSSFKPFMYSLAPAKAVALTSLKSIYSAFVISLLLF